MEQFKKWFTPERAIAMQGLGMGLSQMAMGQAPDLSPAYRALQDRQMTSQMQGTLKDSGLMEKFNPEQRAILAQMPPEAAQRIIAQHVFAAPAAPTKGVEINGQLVNPQTGQIMGDFRDAPENDPMVRIVSGDEAKKFGLPDDGSAYELTFTPTGSLQNATRLGASTQVNVSNGGSDSDVWGSAPNDHVWLRDAQGAVLTEPDPSGRGVRPIATPIGNSKADQALQAAQAEKATAKSAIITEAQGALDLIQSIKSDPALESVTGNIQGNLPAGIPFVTGGQAGADLGVKIEQLQGKTFLQAFESLKGGGSITAIEGEKGQNAIARLQRAQSYEAYIEALTDLEEVVMTGLARAQGDEAPVEADPLGLFK